MKYRYKFKNEEELKQLIKDNKDKYIEGYEYLSEGDFIIFSDIDKTMEEKIQILENIITNQNEKIKKLESAIFDTEIEK